MKDALVDQAVVDSPLLNEAIAESVAYSDLRLPYSTLLHLIPPSFEDMKMRLLISLLTGAVNDHKGKF